VVMNKEHIFLDGGQCFLMDFTRFLQGFTRFLTALSVVKTYVTLNHL